MLKINFIKLLKDLALKKKSLDIIADCTQKNIYTPGRWKKQAKPWRLNVSLGTYVSFGFLSYSRECDSELTRHIYYKYIANVNSLQHYPQ